MGTERRWLRCSGIPPAVAVEAVTQLAVAVLASGVTGVVVAEM
jgi:hypothetical protein